MVGMMLAIQEFRKKSIEELEAFEANFCEVVIDGENKSVSVPGEKYLDWKKLSKRVDTVTISLINFPRSLVVSLVSYFDVFVGRLIRTIYLRKPELLNASEKKLSFEELTRFESIGDVREYLIEKEVESVLRSSHIDQFRWMEKMYDLPLTKDLKSWPAFIELTERRNLFVHTGGVVSSQYLSICKKHGCDVAEATREGAKLGVPQQYFEESNEIAFEIGVKLGHVLWRKLFPEELAESDQNLIKVSYELLVDQKYQLAAKILDFACEGLKKHGNEIFKLMLTVNRALAYKWMGNEKSAKHAMKGVDWSAKGDEFKLANAVILDDWAAAVRLMHRIGKSGPVEKPNYRSWPLFKEFRKRDDFKAAYREIFGEAFEAAAPVKDEPADLGESDAGLPALIDAGGMQTLME